MYSIGQVAEMFGLPISTLRYYDKQGLFPNMERVSGIRKFSEAAIMRGYMARPCDVYFTLERKLERFLQLTLRIYCVPEEKQREVMALIASLDIRAIANEVMQKLVAALEMHYEFTLGEEAKQI